MLQLQITPAYIEHLAPEIIDKILFSICSSEAYTAYRQQSYSTCCSGYGGSSCHGMNVQQQSLIEQYSLLISSVFQPCVRELHHVQMEAHV